MFQSTAGTNAHSINVTAHIVVLDTFRFFIAVIGHNYTQKKCHEIHVMQQLKIICVEPCSNRF